MFKISKADAHYSIGHADSHSEKVLAMIGDIAATSSRHCRREAN
jgi:hypothetical protein